VMAVGLEAHQTGFSAGSGVDLHGDEGATLMSEGRALEQLIQVEIRGEGDSSAADVEGEGLGQAKEDADGALEVLDGIFASDSALTKVQSAHESEGRGDLHEGPIVIGHGERLGLAGGAAVGGTGDKVPVLWESLILLEELFLHHIDV